MWARLHCVSHLWSAVQVKNQCVMLRNNTPDPLTRFSSVCTVLQKATKETVSWDLSCFNLVKVKRRKQKKSSRGVKYLSKCNYSTWVSSWIICSFTKIASKILASVLHYTYIYFITFLNKALCSLLHYISNECRNYTLHFHCLYFYSNMVLGTHYIS